MLALLVPGVGMGGGVAASPSVSTYVVPVHVQRGVKQPDVPSTHGPGLG